jgi:hypothetical protein
MPVYGDLRTFSLTEVLRWAGEQGKTGVLELERNGITRRIEFRKGHVGSCSSNDPSSRLGQFLLSRTRINEIQLQHLLTLQGTTGKRLGLLLVEMGLLSRQELASEVASKAEETIHALFDWDDAFFRFDDGATLDPDQIEVNLPVERLIAEGHERTEKLEHIRETFESSGVVLQRTQSEIPPELLDRPVTRRILDSIDGQRTLAEILLHTRASEFVVLHFLQILCERELLEIREVRTPVTEGATLLDAAPPKRLADPLSPLEWTEFEPGRQGGVDMVMPVAEPEVALDAEIEKARQLMAEGSDEAAVEVLRTSCREHATDYARRMLVKAENAVVARVWEDTTFNSSFPVLLRSKDELLAEGTAPDESFLLSLIDGMTDFQAILWLTPMREVDVVIALKRMLDKGMIEMTKPSSDELDHKVESARVRWASEPAPTQG